MTKTIIKNSAFTLFFVLLAFYSKAQDDTDSAKTQSNAKVVVDAFHKGIGMQSELYNGIEYVYYPLYIKSNAYFNDVNEFKPATVSFDGDTYHAVPVMYDLFKNKLVALYTDKTSMYVLASDRVKSFNLMGHSFKYISADTVKNASSSGFYDQLYTGKTSALARYTKTLQASMSGNISDSYFTPVKSTYYIEKGNQLNSFSSMGGLLSILKNHKAELQKYIKAKNIDYKKDPSGSIAAVAAYYNKLNN